MIHEIGVELNVILAGRGVPHRVVDGPEGTQTTTWGRERIVIEHDPNGDSFGPPKSQHINPKQRAIRNTGVKLTIYARSPNPGAQEWEHRRRADAVLDQVLTALSQVAAVRKQGVTLKSVKPVVPVDLAKTEVQGGMVYELAVSFERGVFETTWTGDAQPTATLGANPLASTTKVSLAHGPDDDNDPRTPPSTAETACGN